MSTEPGEIVLIDESDELLLVEISIRGSFTKDVPNAREQYLADICSTKPGGKRLLVDLSSCSHLDSTGIGWLIRLHRDCEQSKGQLVIHSVPENVLRIIRRLRLDTFFHLAADAAAARDHSPKP